MSELTLESPGLTAEEISALPTRRTWYGVAGGKGSALIPQNLTESHEEAHARAITHNVDYPALGPWHVVALTENLRVPA